MSPTEQLLTRLEREAATDGIPIVARPVAVLIHVLTRLVRPELIVELGTATGYSGIWLLRAWPAAHLLTFEVDASRAASARRNFEEAGVGKRAEVRVENAIEGLERIPSGSAEVVFNDVLNGLRTLERVERCFWLALNVLKPGGLLLADNTLGDGEVARRETRQARRVHRWNNLVQRERSLTGMILPIGDGLSISVRS
jgi:predicted O-methyltransferase YrrM